ncbi:MAG: FAD-dependent oxidoreductase [Candidatus Omnitrophica bacterium]|nr:FAD-dependent oxidoreductase [Candidatus Omnitrophota bacterium]MDD5027545.1 FAD-dependent oxidoreductase [Candidatus Omnitrophota bacterium]
MYDLIIVGAGPAGITASVYAARKKMDFLVVTGDIGGQTAWSGDIGNYTGYQFITGPDLVEKFEEHMFSYNTSVKGGEEVIEVTGAGEGILVKTNKASYQAKAVIVASGKRSRELGVPGEKEYKNKGISYCATCDGPLFSAKNVAIIGGGNSALDAALQLIKIAKYTYIINNTPKLGGDALMRQKIEGARNVEILNNTEVTAVFGAEMVNAVKVNYGGEEKILPVEGIFVEIGLIPNADFVKGVEKNSRGEIKVNSRNETSSPGIFAAGDVTDVPEKQIIIAAGEGAKACLAAFRYVARH